MRVRGVVDTGCGVSVDRPGYEQGVSRQSCRI